MLSPFRQADRWIALAVLIFAALAQMTLAQAQTAVPSQPVPTGKPDAAKGVWAVRFELTNSFSPVSPGEFLNHLQQYAKYRPGQDGGLGHFKTTKQGIHLVGSFLAYDPDQLKAALAKVPDLKVTSADKLTADQLTAYENSPQESLMDFNHPDATIGVWAVRFELTSNFAPKSADEFVTHLHEYADCYSGHHGEIGHFRATKSDGKLIGSLLAYDPDQLKAALAKVPDLKITSSDKLTQDQVAAYLNLPAELP
jgi:hypothetical protein